MSGGGDSLALALMLAEWAKANGLAPPVALIVDHRLRKGSAKDADTAARWLRASCVTAHVLTWTGKKPASDVEAEARAARYRLMGRMVQAGRGVKFLYVAHTLEDQAETFLLRLASRQRARRFVGDARARARHTRCRDSVMWNFRAPAARAIARVRCDACSSRRANKAGSRIR